MMAPVRTTRLESMGIYLPPKELKSIDVLKGCREHLLFPIQSVTGIESTHWAGDDEFSIDLAKMAVADCLAGSRYAPVDIDIVICSNISRCDGPGFHYSFEPNTAVRIKHHFGFERAIAFDISNACPGMFTAIKVVDALIRVGAIHCGMVVSGEYITHLARTAQQEVQNLRDPRLACLTLGDAGAAVILDGSAQNGSGFQAIDLYTDGAYSSLCIAKVSDQPHGGAIMHTHPTKLTPVAVEHATAHAVHTLRKHDWSVDTVQHLIPHQTSRKTLGDMTAIIDKMFDNAGWAESITVDTLTRHGNTATTSHFVAAIDAIRQGRIQSHDHVVFSIAGSGLTVGTALYAFDDLPDRLRRRQNGDTPSVRDAPAPVELPDPETPAVWIRSAGAVTDDAQCPRTSIDLACQAALQCLAPVPLDKNDISLLIFTGMYRTDFVFEPAMAALVAGALEINDDVTTQNDKKVLAFDLFGGGRGFLSACHIATKMMQTREFDHALVVTSEVENNRADGCPERLRGVEETGGALLLSTAPDDRRGFGRFLFRDFTRYLDDFETHCGQVDGLSFVRIEEDEHFEQHLADCIDESVAELLHLEQLSAQQIRWVLAPQRSSAFLGRLSERLGIDREQFVDVTRAETDLFTSSIAHAFRALVAGRKAQPGDVGLLIDAGAGIQVGCAIYRF